MDDPPVTLQRQEFRIEELERRIADLEARLNRFAINSERAGELGSLFLTAGAGNNGSAKTVARSDHTH